MKLIMLDIDGVLNHEEGYINKECIFHSDRQYQGFAPEIKRLLNLLIEKTGAKLVISSTWRSDGIERLKQIFEWEGIIGEIVGVTPHFSIKGYGSEPRGCEIECYLEEQGFWHINWCKDEQRKYMDKSGIDNYIILDDDSDMLYNQRNHFIHVLPSPRNKSGFNEFYYERALAVLLGDVVGLNYE